MGFLKKPISNCRSIPPPPLKSFLAVSQERNKVRDNKKMCCISRKSCPGFFYGNYRSIVLFPPTLPHYNQVPGNVTDTFETSDDAATNYDLIKKNNNNKKRTAKRRRRRNKYYYSVRAAVTICFMYI